MIISKYLIFISCLLLIENLYFLIVLLLFLNNIVRLCFYSVKLMIHNFEHALKCFHSFFFAYFLKLAIIIKELYILFFFSIYYFLSQISFICEVHVLQISLEGFHFLRKLLFKIVNLALLFRRLWDIMRAFCLNRLVNLIKNSLKKLAILKRHFLI